MIVVTKALAPFVPSRLEVVTRMLSITCVGANDVVVDLGCGDGRVMFSAILDFSARKAIGYEMKRDLCMKVSREIVKKNLQDRAILMNCDLMDADLSEATVITLYLTTSGNERLKPKLLKETRIGTRIVSHDFEMKGWYPSIKENFRGHILYLYVVPEAFP